MGAYHTIDLELNRKFTLLKEYWDLIALERVGEYSTTKVAVKLLLQVLQLFLEYRLYDRHPSIEQRKKFDRVIRCVIANINNFTY